MIKVYFEPIETLPTVPLIASMFRYDAFFRNAPYIKRAYESLTEQFVERVDKPEDADFILLPHDYAFLFERSTYVAAQRSIAQRYQKPLLIYISTDFDITIDWPEVVIFRTSGYKSALQKNECIMPPVVEDLLGGQELVVRKAPEIPSIGFVGWAGFSSVKQSIRSRLKDLLQRILWRIRGVQNGHRRKGVFLRLELMNLLSASSVVKTNFIVRDSYSGSIKASPNLDVDAARQQYIENIKMTDMTLALRGDGNFSQRFYECLSLGRIPLFVDTDAQLPLEDIVSYERFVIRVPYADRQNTLEYIKRFFDGLTDEAYAAKQREARDAYERYLSIAGFCRYMFKEEHVREYLSPELFGS